MEIVESHSLMSGRLQIVRFSDRKNYYARIYNPSTRNRIARSLRTTDIAIATDRAIEVWSDLAPLIEREIPVTSGSIETVVQTYLDAEQARVAAGQVLQGTVTDKQAQRRPMLLFCQLNNLRRITDIKPHSLNGFTAWRRDESRKLTTGKDDGKPLELSSLNKGIREVRAFFKWARHQHLTDVELELMEVTVRHERERKKNVAFTPEDYKKLSMELERWAITEASAPRHVIKRIRPSHWYSRRTFYYLLSILCLTGMRPTEATEKVLWKDITFRNKGETKAARAMDTACTIHIRNAKGKGSRHCVSNAGWVIKSYRQYITQFRSTNGYRPLKPTDNLIQYPPTEETYRYSQFGNEMRALVKRCNLEGRGYTIRSCRGYYVTQQLADGVPPYIVAKNSGHSVEVMRSAYEQLSPEQLMEVLCS